MKTGEAEKLAKRLAKEAQGDNEPKGETIAALLGAAAVNLARIADALEARNEALRAGSWAAQA